MTIVHREMPWPVTLRIARLRLRPVEHSDLPVMTEIWTSPQVRRYLGGPVPPGELAARLGGCAGAPGLFGVVRAADRVVLGLVLVEPASGPGDPHRADDAEVSYQLLPQSHGVVADDRRSRPQRPPSRSRALMSLPPGRHSPGT